MSRRKTTIILICCAAVIGVGAAVGIVAFPSYREARAAVEPLFASAPDGPWESWRVRLVSEFDGTWLGKPCWVFRYRNPETGQKSVRMYVRLSGNKRPYYNEGLDPRPMWGILP